MHLEHHFRSMLWFVLLIFSYCYLIFLTHKKSDSLGELEMNDNSKKNLLVSNSASTEKVSSKTTTQQKPRRSFFD